MDVTEGESTSRRVLYINDERLLVLTKTRSEPTAAQADSPESVDSESTFRPFRTLSGRFSPPDSDTEPPFRAGS
ncbi:hypothetical protein [Haloferax chudinovii]|uniref:Uncharacterized protein n=1 Tax=Haloferax chudinovii TaxID=1109010 RepID=A0ABD5XDC1_9EURY